MDRLAIWAAGLRMNAPALAPPTRGGPLGEVGTGRRLLTGRFMFQGYLIEAPDLSPWDLPTPDPVFGDDLHGFAWLEDLLSTGQEIAESRARGWVIDWIDQFGTGRGPGWHPELAGRRLGAWIDHAETLREGLSAGDDRRFRMCCLRHAAFLRRRWPRARPGLPRYHALSGLLAATLSLGAMSRRVPSTVRALGRECNRTIDPDGAIASRNPEELLGIFRVLVRATGDLREAGRDVPDEFDRAIRSMAVVLRSLRHADGSLPRFHGGGRSVPGRIETALAAAGVPHAPPLDRVMGYARLRHGRTSLVLDAASPRTGPGSQVAHASTLAFELTSGRRPVIVNCGSGRVFGDRWLTAGRATASHSTLALDGYSSARVSADENALLREGPGDVRVETRSGERFTGLICSHDGYAASHGLTHMRQINLGRDGRGLKGEDVITTLGAADEALFDDAVSEQPGRGLPFRIRFHLHPDVASHWGEDGQSIMLLLKSGEVWIFRHTGVAAISVEPSVYLDAGAPEPRPTRQIVLASRAVDYATRVTWTLAKGRETPDAVRDHVHDDRPVLV